MSPTLAQSQQKFPPRTLRIYLLVLPQVCGQLDHALLLEVAAEGILFALVSLRLLRSRCRSIAGWHFCQSPGPPGARKSQRKRAITYPSTGAETCCVTHLDGGGGIVGCCGGWLVVVGERLRWRNLVVVRRLGYVLGRHQQAKRTPPARPLTGEAHLN